MCEMNLHELFISAFQKSFLIPPSAQLFSTALSLHAPYCPLMPPSGPCDPSLLISLEPLPPSCSSLHLPVPAYTFLFQPCTFLFQRTPSCSTYTFLFEATPSCSSLHFLVPAYTFLFQPTLSCSSLPLPVQACTFLFQPTPSFFSLHFPVPAYTFLFKPAPSCSSLHLPVPV